MVVSDWRGLRGQYPRFAALAGCVSWFRRGSVPAPVRVAVGALRWAARRCVRIICIIVSRDKIFSEGLLPPFGSREGR